MSETKVLPSEALFGFMGWLTSRGAVSGPFSASHDASSAAELVAEFVKSQGWEMPRDEFPKMLAEYPASPEPLTTDAPPVALSGDMTFGQVGPDWFELKGITTVTGNAATFLRHHFTPRDGALVLGVLDAAERAR